ncbi:MAG TPA: flavin reductase family protein [Ktedonobacterales bacterium]|jgi:flavin reductase (DIM6/NTAB) family NADH-FMN oxidoreductase RutF
MDEQAIQQLTSTLWAPLVAISTTAGGQANAQIAVSALNASILRERPRVLIEIWKANYTHHLLMEGGVFVLHLLSEQNLHLIERLGMRSGRDGDKLAGLRWEARQTGSPILLETLGYIDCRVRGTLDAGDMTCFLGEVVDGGPLNSGSPITWHEARSRLPAEVLARYEEHQARQREVARGLLGNA